ncbi:septal ring lytic transglycosylase RlpA family protein [Breznakiella homolactica]|uniref:Probable endolytic peptidoglycan transglycosylase RlpA n=1 Tax=Breznakiella homolactica TaxID=2798577 RepID=A0A7T7XMY0_9SPIR|nr:septal ring lytic transglycosylase RlpA family protein [Breznakiella homolactica]QQO09316.1 septal ring lytic transglycosylase RlpA family protein [Breznakiella homolactica]
MKQTAAVFLLGIVAAALCAAQGTETQTGSSFKQEGIASWYGAEFAGRPTASGEIFDPRLMTAAHPTLPFGTKVRVTNTHNNRQVTVTVNDRGPFVAARIIDLSEGAAEKLDMLVTGTAPVRIEVIGGLASAAPAEQNKGGAISGPPPVASPQPLAAAPQQPAAVPQQPAAVPQQPAAVPQQPAAVPQPTAAPQQPAAPPGSTGIPAVSPAVSTAAETAPVSVPQQPTAAPVPVIRQFAAAEIKPKMPDPGSGKIYRIQVGSYKIPRNAVEAFGRLQDAGLNPAYERYGELYRVVLSGIKGDDVQSVAAALGKAGFSEALIREESPGNR